MAKVKQSIFDFDPAFDFDGKLLVIPFFVCLN